MKLPLKTRIFEYVIDKNAPVNVNEIYVALSNEYGDEKQFTKKRIREYLGQFLTVKFMEASNLRFEENEIEMDYVITDYGLTREKYIRSHR